MATSASSVQATECLLIKVRTKAALLWAVGLECGVCVWEGEEEAAVLPLAIHHVLWEVKQPVMLRSTTPKNSLEEIWPGSSK